MHFHVVTLRASGVLLGHRSVETDDCHPGLTESLGKHIRAKWGHLGWIYLPLPESMGPIGLAWRRIGWSAVARFEVQGYVASAEVLLTGLDLADDETSTLLLEAMVTSVLEAAGLEPPSEVESTQSRPAVLRVAWKNEFANLQRRRLVRRLERALGAAFFGQVKELVTNWRP